MIIPDTFIRGKWTNRPADEYEGGANYKPKPGGFGGLRYLTSRTNRTYVLFQWAFLDDTSSFIAGMLCVFICSVIATIIIQLLSKFEKEAIQSIARSRYHNIKRISPSLLLAVALAFTSRMALSYLLVLALLDMNVWILTAILTGHFFGWILYSATISPADAHPTLTYHQQQQQQQQNNRNNGNSKSKNKNKNDSLDSKFNKGNSSCFDSNTTDSDGESV